MVVGLAGAIALGSSWSAAGDGERELLRERIEALRAGRIDPGLEGTIAATRVIPGFYERRGFTRAWTAPLKDEQLVGAIRDAEADGLDPEDYHLSAIESMKRRLETGPNPSIEALVDYDILLTDALVRLGYHILFGKVDLRAYDPVWNYGREIHDLDPAVAIQNTLDAPDLRAAIEREKPSYAAYAALKAQLARYRALLAAGGWPAVPPGPTLRVGDRGPRIRALRERLAVTGDMPAVDGRAVEMFDQALSDGVKGFQRRHGLDADGAVGSRTIEEMNISAGHRVDQLRVNLERGRWLTSDIGTRFVIVNIAGFTLYYVDGNRIRWTTRVQVGKPYRKTPVFRSKMTYLVFNPTWTVPPGILANDILPAVKRDRSTLERKNLKVLDGKGDVVDPSSIDWSRYSGQDFPYLLRQDPGPDNALGRVKFMFPNEHAVYLHDTPSKSLFEKEDRAFSSGCIRVADPMMLAELLLEETKGWSRADIDAAVAAGTTRSVSFAKPIPILLAYWTAWDDNGSLQFRRDLYDRDERILEGLNAKFSFDRRSPGPSRDREVP
jgi:murein L,D-transpeptidase YcbB/YkuD